jgi:hypothetical protein
MQRKSVRLMKEFGWVTRHRYDVDAVEEADLLLTEYKMTQRYILEAVQADLICARGSGTSKMVIDLWRKLASEGGPRLRAFAKAIVDGARIKNAGLAAGLSAPESASRLCARAYRLMADFLIASERIRQ